MKLKPNAGLFSATGLMQVLLTSVTYWFFLLLTSYLLQQFSWVQFRFATFVPVVAGMMFGLPGAVGAALGNILIDIGTNPEPLLLLAASVMNFFLAYLPYRLWYGWPGSRPLRLVYDSKSFARFSGIIVLNGFIFGVVLTALVDIFYHDADATASNFYILFSNNYLYPLLLGLPILLFWRRHSTLLFAPPASGQKAGWQLRALALLTLLDAGYLFLLVSTPLPQLSSMLAVGLNFLLLSYICTLPPQGQSAEAEADADYSSLGSNVSELLLFFITGFILLALLISLLLNPHAIDTFNSTAAWHNFYLVLGLIINCGFFFLYFFMHWLENTISLPLNALSLRAKHYVENGGEEEAVNITDKVAKNEMEVLGQVFDHMSMDIRQYLHDLTTASEAKHALQAQLDVATQIQQGTLPNLDEVNAALQEKAPAYQVKGGMQAAKHVGGDMYDCYLIDDDHLMLSVGDVSGKGIPAALFAVVTQALLSNSAYDRVSVVHNLSGLVEELNASLEEKNEEVLFVTLWTSILELSTGKISYVNAGHNPPLLGALDGSGNVSFLDELSGPVLGLMPEISYTLQQAQLAPGQKLLIFTDGLNEAENAAHEFFGDERLNEAFLAAKSPEEIMQKIADFVGDAPPSDDKTYLWVERK